MLWVTFFDGSSQVMVSSDDGRTFEPRTVTLPDAPQSSPTRWWWIQPDPDQPSRLLGVVSFRYQDANRPPGNFAEYPNLIASEDDGQTWALQDLPNGDQLEDLRISEDGRLLIMTRAGEVSIREPKSMDWRRSGSVPQMRSRTLWADFKARDTFYLNGITNGSPARRVLLKSTDAAASWSTLIDDGFGESILPVDPGHLIGMSSIGWRVSRDDGKTWNQTFYTPGRERLVISRTPAVRRIYAVGYQSIVHSDDMGQTWKGQLLESHGFREVVADPNDPDVLYGILAGTGTGTGTGLFRSQDAGARWSALDLGRGPIFLISSVLPLATTPSTLLVATSAGLLRSEDGGSSWQTALEGSSGYLFFSAPSAPGTVAAVRGSELLWSVDAGSTWNGIVRLNGLVADAQFHPTNPDVLFVVGDRGFYAASLSQPESPAGTAIPVARNNTYPPPGLIAATEAGPVYVVDRFNQLWHSLDHGKTWDKPIGGMTGIRFHSVSLDPTGPDSVLLSTDGGLLRAQF